MKRRILFLITFAVLSLAACTPTTPSSVTNVAPAATEAAPSPADPTDLPEPTLPPAQVTEAVTAQPSEAIVITDGLGRQVSLEQPAQRVVSLAPSNTEILFAVGAGDRVVGRDDFSDYPAEASSLPTVGGSFSGYNNEAIVDLEPDLVLAAEINTPEQVKALEDLGLTVFYLANPVDLEGLYQNLHTVAQLTGQVDEADTLVESLKERVAGVTDKIAPISARPTVFYELDNTDPSAPFTAGEGTFIDTLIGMAGGENIGRALNSQYGQLSIEELLVQDPDIIVLGDSNYGVTVESVAERAGWEALEAVKNDRVYPFDDNLVSRPGPRMVDGLEALVKIIHPDLFE